jgi:hypothetical protein
MKKENILSIIICAIAIVISLYVYSNIGDWAGSYRLAISGIVVVKGMLLIFSLSIAIYMSRLFCKK